jgi:hypothetical protein
MFIMKPTITLYSVHVLDHRTVLLYMYYNSILKRELQQNKLNENQECDRCRVAVHTKARQRMECSVRLYEEHTEEEKNH